MKLFGNHIDPEKEEQLKVVKIEVENKVKKILKLANSINGNKDGNTKKKSEIIHLVEDFHQHYELLYSMYEDLRGEVKNNVNVADDDSSGSFSDSEAFYSPMGSTPKSSSSSRKSTPHSNDNQDSESSDIEDTVLKDKLTSSSETKGTNIFGSQVQEFNENSENATQRLAQMEELEGEVARLKIEMENFCSHKQQWEEQVDCNSREAMQMREKKSRLEARVLEFEASWKDKERLQLEMEALNVEKCELEKRLSCETKEKSLQVKDLMDQVDSLQQELVSVNSQKSELELKLKKKSTEKMSDYHAQTENYRNKSTNQGLIEKGIIEEKESSEVQAKDRKLEVHSLSRKKSNLEELIMMINQEANQAEVEKQELQQKISQLQSSLSKSEKELSAQQKKLKSCENELSAQIKSLIGKVKNQDNMLEALQKERNSLHVDLEASRNDKNQYLMELKTEKQEFSQMKSKMERKNTELTQKIADQQKTLLELADAMSMFKVENEKAQTRAPDSKLNFHLVERKVEEMAEELRKHFEDKNRILSRRIRVAEQLHVENKEWYRKTREAYEQENKDLQESISRYEVGLRNIKDMSVTANDMLILLDSLALKFDDCKANFLNRISKASCELKFAKDWARRKNEALIHAKRDLDSSLSQLDKKEAEILVFREKLWKSENRSRELDKQIKKKEEGMLVLQEEKREAIRQLCVWIDYHRSRSDYYMKMLFEMNPGRRKVS